VIAATPGPQPGTTANKENAVKPTLQITFSTFTVKNGGELKVEIPVFGQGPLKSEWKKDGNAVKETSRLEVSATPSSTVLHIRHAAREHAGQYSIRVSNSAGNVSGEITVVVLEKPDPPTGPIRIVDVSSDCVTISWEPPEYLGGCQLDNYVVEKRETSSTNWQTVSATTVRTTIKVTKLKTGSEYQFRVFAENRYGKSTAITSPIVIAQYPFSVPAAPGTPFVSTVTKYRETFVIDADYFGKPLPQVLWLKDGKEIDKVTPRTEVKNTLTHTTLTVRECTRADGGLFVLTLINMGGTTSVRKALTILPN
uniref:Titin n=1 Tax=Cynoglossus semilaevis TaxID=244447 RepID=A0A3P8W5J8_CYNSE